MLTFWVVVNTLAMLVMALAAGYFFLAVGLGVRELRRRRVPLGFQSGLDYGHPFVPLPGAPSSSRPQGAASHYSLCFLIACLNEEQVIAATVRGLVDPSGRSRTVVVDDGSDDATGMVAASAAEVAVVRRSLPQARMGKGAALNAGLGWVLADVEARGLEPSRVIVCVMDADGRLSDGVVDEVLPLFEDPQVGGVQLPVRIRNRSQNFLLTFQDYQFWTQSALTQFGRIATDTVSLGGNGQFTRLSALLEVGREPWSRALTEDLDLTISLAVRGWKTTSTPRAAVDQQGVDRFGPLVRQRTRWYQGHMLAAKRVPEVLSSTRLSNASSLEIVLYMAVPWVLDLPWSVLYHLVIAEIVTSRQLQTLSSLGWWGACATVVLWYLLGFWPALITAVLAYRRDRELSPAGALKMGHAFVLTNYLSYICVWRAWWRILRGQHGWVKTSRLVEHETPAPIGAGVA